MAGKRKADEMSEGEEVEPPKAAKKSKKAKLADARRKAASAMAADKARVDEVKKKSAVGSPDNGTKQSPKKKAPVATSKKTTTPARNGQNRTASSAAAASSTGQTVTQGGGDPATISPTIPTTAQPTTSMPTQRMGQPRMNVPPQAMAQVNGGYVTSDGKLEGAPPRNPGPYHQNVIQEDVHSQRPSQSSEHEFNSPSPQVHSSSTVGKQNYETPSGRQFDGADEEEEVNAVLPTIRSRVYNGFCAVFTFLMYGCIFLLMVLVILLWTSDSNLVNIVPDEVSLEIKNIDTDVPIICPNEHYQVSMDNTCVLTQRAIETIDTLRSLLITKTLSDQCGISPSESFPLFSYYDLQLESPLELATYQLDSDVLGQVFKLGRNDEGSILIGLPEDFALPFDASCQLTRFFRFFLASLGMYSVLALRGIATFLFKFVKSNPLASLVICIVAWIFHYIRSNRAQRAKLLEDVAYNRERVFERLQGDLSRSFVAAHLLHEFAPHRIAEKKEHKHFISKIWPRVVSDVKYDTRIRKTTQMIDGEPKDVWKWVAPLPSSTTKKSKEPQ